MIRFLAICLMLLAGAAQAKTQCAFLPLCLATFSPPLDGIRVYENNVLKQDTHPFWFPAGNVRTSALWCTANATAVIKPCVYRGAEEFCGLPSIPPGMTVPAICGSAFAPTYTMGTLITWGQLYASAPQMCASDTTCLAVLANKCPLDTMGSAGLQVLFDRCLADDTCEDALAKALPDVDQDGVKTAGDYYWWYQILEGGKNL